MKATIFVASTAAAIKLTLGLGKTTVEKTDQTTAPSSAARRAVVSTGAVAAALALAPRDYGVARAGPSDPETKATGRNNIVFVTFDALGAEHMSMYGCDLPTTPRIDAFARTATVFDNLYSCSTFTTPSVASILTGLYPCDTHIQQMFGVPRNQIAVQTVVRRLRAGGYQTLGAVGNLAVDPRRLGISADFSALAPPTIPFAAIAAATIPIDPVLASTIASEEGEVTAMRERLALLSPDHRAEHLFAAGLELVDKADTSRPFFLWVHVLAPHHPYLPATPFLKRFLPTDEMRSIPEMELSDQSGLYYPPARQPLVDKARLRYAESLAEADQAFDDFLSGLTRRGLSETTAVVVSGDHGESFVGGVYRHGGPGQSRQIIHVPLIVRLPGTSTGRRVATVCDQTSIAPTLIDIAGLPKAPWMRSSSLLRPVVAAPVGAAFTQYLEQSSAFHTPRRGTVGVVANGWQCVLDIATGQSVLRPLAEANNLQADRSVEHPALAAAMRAQILARFPSFERRDA